MKKIIVSVVLLIVFGLVPVFAMGGKPSQNEKSQTAQEWKTYVSKYGFSVSYPADWYLEEKKDIKLTQEELDGYISFTICDFNPDNPEERVESKGITIEYLFRNNVTMRIEDRLIPKGSKDKILFLAREHNVYVGKEDDTIKMFPVKNGPDMFLIYYDGKRLRRALFYIKKTDALVIVNVSEKAQKEFYEIVNTIRFISEK